MSCRGCNAFFRRAITYGLAFTCRRDGNCRVDKNARCACRACRLKKCEKNSSVTLVHGSQNNSFSRSSVYVLSSFQRSRRRTMLCTSVEEMLCDELEDQLRKPAEGRDVASNFRVQVILMFEWVSKLEEFR
ncbi:unnamed protein product [Anisakis simplex]|uniref:Nuclear receptor domain-containing protein n=1 Tax=Anisakis simplex TaxID=6269 RepID=A0A3P6NHE7_ANISI|nr:unnamed protein product [Anisakis simplex]